MAPVEFEPLTVQLIYGVSLVTSVFLAVVVWRHREKTGAVPLLVAILGGLSWSTTLFVNTLVADFTTSRYLLGANYVGVVVAVAGVFLFSLEYTGREHLLDRRTVALLAVEPAIVVPLALFNPGNVFFDAVYPADRAIGVWSDFGVAFFLHTLYSYGLVLVASALIVGLIYRTRAMYWGQLAVLVGAVLLPLLPNALGIAQVVNFDATPLGILVSNVLYTVAITRYRLIDLAPIARDRVVDTINSAVYVVDVEDRIVDVNPAGDALMDRLAGESGLVGEDARALLAPYTDVAALYDDIVAHDMERRVEYEIAGGHFLVDASPIDDSLGRHVGWLFVVRDITERKRREEELRERNEQLDTFASVVSHDLRNPLQVANGRIEIARETGDVDHLDAAETALDRMETIVDDVLEMTRDGNAATDLAPVPVEAAATAAWNTAGTDGASLDVETDARITADRDRLVRLLENLFRNAVEHAPPGPPSSPTQEDGAPTVTVDVVREGGNPVGIAVADDGRGIPPDERDRIFETGYSTGNGGTGFGLTIVSQIADAHGWDVRVTESEAGGARFEITGAEMLVG